MSSNGSNGNKNESEYARLNGREFEIVKQGLDVEQVKEFVQGLIAERDTLMEECKTLKQREEHYKSLTRLAEKTVMEADKLAGEIKDEVMEKAEAEADVMRQNLKELLLKVYDGVSEELDSINKKVADSRATFEKSFVFSDNGKDQSPVTSGLVGAEIEQKAEQTSPAAESSPVATITVEEEEKEKSQPEEKCENLMAKIHDKEIQLDIMPPIDISLVSKIITNLYDLPKVEDAELLTDSECPSIVIMENEPIDLTDFSKKLAEFPQVEEAKVIKTDSGGKGGRSRKIELILAGSKK